MTGSLLGKLFCEKPGHTGSSNLSRCPWEKYRAPLIFAAGLLVGVGAAIYENRKDIMSVIQQHMTLCEEKLEEKLAERRLCKQRWVSGWNNRQITHFSSGGYIEDGRDDRQGYSLDIDEFEVPEVLFDNEMTRTTTTNSTSTIQEPEKSCQCRKCVETTRADEESEEVEEDEEASTTEFTPYTSDFDNDDLYTISSFPTELESAASSPIYLTSSSISLQSIESSDSFWEMTSCVTDSCSELATPDSTDIESIGYVSDEDSIDLTSRWVRYNV